MPVDLIITFATGVLVLGFVVSHAFRRDFDPFAPLWLFLAGYAQVYVIQAISYREYALRARGVALVTEANLRALWALIWFLAVYHSGIARRIAVRLPRAPTHWSPGLIVGMAPLLIVWGLVCAGVALRDVEVQQEENIFRQFPVVMLAAGILLTVTGRNPERPNLALSLVGILVITGYVAIWMFNARRSHSVIGVLTGVAAWYLPRWRRPSIFVMALTAAICVFAVSLSLGWRNNLRYERSVPGFLQFLTEFDPSSLLVNMNMKERAEDEERSLVEQSSKETEEYGGFLLMMDTVPTKSAFDYGTSYLRIFSTYVPRLLWPNKPIYGREAWINAWMAGSEFHRNPDFTGPAIGILGATQLNGGAIATVIVLAALALMLRTGYDYFRFHAASPWAQAWWSLTYYNAWLMTVNDDPMVWYYYIYGYTTLPLMLFLFIAMKLATPAPVAGTHPRLVTGAGT
jgi:hypothetical protein